jgi:hypothetical protein
MNRSKNSNEMRKRTDGDHIPLFIHNLSSIRSFSFGRGIFCPFVRFQDALQIESAYTSVAQFIYLMSTHPPFFLPIGIWAKLQYFKARNSAQSPPLSLRDGQKMEHWIWSVMEAIWKRVTVNTFEDALHHAFIHHFR